VEDRKLPTSESNMITERLKSSIIFITTLTGIWLLFYYSWLCCSCYSHNGFFVYKTTSSKKTLSGEIMSSLMKSLRIQGEFTTLTLLSKC